MTLKISHSAYELKRIEKIYKKIEELRPKMICLTDEQLQKVTVKLKQRLQMESLEAVLPEAFAAMREADRRILGMEPYPVQILGGIIMSQGRVAEMCTGEGKTLVCTLPCYLYALTGKGVHVITVNDYLSQRDCELMRPAYEFMGLSCGNITQKTEQSIRKKQYAKDITYITNSEIGFDYLRDHMVTRKAQLVQRGLHFCIIDEIDSVLIDEARTPLIISGKTRITQEQYCLFDQTAKLLVEGTRKEASKIDYITGETSKETGDYIVDEKNHTVFLTEEGHKALEEAFCFEKMGEAFRMLVLHGVIMALQANKLMTKDKDYVVKEGQVHIVDTFTGRLMEGRRFSDGLHQALEAKEGVTIHPENTTMATISYQSFFNKYELKCGMTGTAHTEEQEFRDIYGMDVVTIPTNRPILRKDLKDCIYKTQKEKYHAILQLVEKLHKKGQPVLVGTTTIEASETLSELFSFHGLNHTVLNAKNDKEEAEIVSRAGQVGAITIATNMAGRGTDIKLSNLSKEAGGLYVIGTQRHESRRIDDQLRGRSGRQGDPGTSCFYLSLEDDLLRLFGSDKYLPLLQKMGVENGKPLKHKLLEKTVEQAQKCIEQTHFDTRKQLLAYDQVNNDQRELIYTERMKILKEENIHEEIKAMICLVVKKAYHQEPEENPSYEETICEKALTRYEEIRKQIDEKYPGDDMLYRIERNILLKNIDHYWVDQIEDMEQLRQGIHLVSYGQKDPKLEYRIQGFRLFEKMINTIKKETVTQLFSLHEF